MSGVKKKISFGKDFTAVYLQMIFNGIWGNFFDIPANILIKEKEAKIATTIKFKAKCNRAFEKVFHDMAVSFTCCKTVHFTVESEISIKICTEKDKAQY